MDRTRFPKRKAPRARLAHQGLGLFLLCLFGCWQTFELSGGDLDELRKLDGGSLDSTVEPGADGARDGQSNNGAMDGNPLGDAPTDQTLSDAHEAGSPGSDDGSLDGPGDGSNDSTSDGPPSAVPTISGFVPDLLQAGQKAASLKIIGSYFDPAAQVNLQGFGSLAPTSVASDQLTVTLPDAATLFGGTLTITVANPGGSSFLSTPKTIKVNNPPPTIDPVAGLDPAIVPTKGAEVVIAISGTNFLPTSTVSFNMTPLAAGDVSYESSTRILVNIPSIPSAGSYPVTVRNPFPGGGTSTKNLMAQDYLQPVVSGLSPNPGPANQDFSMTVTGAGFACTGMNVSLAGTPLPGPTNCTSTSFTTQVTARPTGDYAIQVLNAGTPASNTFELKLRSLNPTPKLKELQPAVVATGIPGAEVILKGSLFVSGAVVTCGSSTWATEYVDSETLRAQLTGAQLQSPSSCAAKVTNPGPGGGTSDSQTFTVQLPNPNPFLQSVTTSPAPLVSGTTSGTVQIAGTGFVAGSTVLCGPNTWIPSAWNEVSLTLTLSALELASPLSCDLVVRNPAPGGGLSTPLGFTIVAPNPEPIVNALSPAFLEVGSSVPDITVLGAQFVPSASVTCAGIPWPTTYLSATTLKVTVPASFLSSAQTCDIAVSNPPPGGGTRGALPFSVLNSVPTVDAIAPNSVDLGSTPVPLTITGSKFVPGASVSCGSVMWPAPSSVTSTTLIVSPPADFLNSAHTCIVQVQNPNSIGGPSVSGPLFTVKNPQPTLTSVVPSFVKAGSSGEVLTLTGTNFVGGATVKCDATPWGNATVQDSQTILVELTASALATAQSCTVTVTNPAPGGGVSPVGRTFTINNPAPTLDFVSPFSLQVGAPTSTLTLSGSNFASGATVTCGSLSWAATLQSPQTLTVNVPSGDLQQGRLCNLTVVNPTPGGGPSSGLEFEIANPAPVLTTLSPNTLTAGTSGNTVIVKGDNFVASSTIACGGRTFAPAFVSTKELQFTPTAAQLVAGFDCLLEVTNPMPGGGTSQQLPFTVNNPPPQLNKVTPASVLTTAAGQVLTLSGSNFVANSSVKCGTSVWSNTSFNSSTSLVVTLDASDLSVAKTCSVSVVNPAPLGGTSGGVNFTINNIAPTLSGISPSTVTVGTSSATLTLTGSNFLKDATVYCDTTPLPTVRLSSTSLEASLTSSDMATARTCTITVQNPSPAAGASTGRTLSVENPSPVLKEFSPASSDYYLGETIVLTGSGFLSGVSKVYLDYGLASERTLTITAIDATSIQVVVPGNAIPFGDHNLTVVNAGPLGGGSSVAPSKLAITDSIPVLTSVSPKSFVIGTPTNLTIQGTNLTNVNLLRIGGTSISVLVPTGATSISVTSTLSRESAPAMLTITASKASGATSAGTLSLGLASGSYTLTNHVQPIFDTWCSSCHKGANASGKLKLDSKANSFAGLVANATTGVSCSATGNCSGGRFRLTPFDISDTTRGTLNVLLDKVVTRTPSCGGPMPTSTSLSTANQDIIKNWIVLGAQNN